MTDDGEFRYVPLYPEWAHIDQLKREPFDLASMSVTGLVIVCDLDGENRVGAGRRPSVHVSITQFLRMSDESMIRLNMDRGYSSFQHGRPRSWKTPMGDVVAGVLTIVQGDEPAPGEFPWEDYAEAAQRRGISVEAETLSRVPYTVLLSDDLGRVYEF